MGRYAPGIPTSELRRMTPPEARHIRKLVEGHLSTEADARLEHTRALMRQIARSGLL